MKKNSFGQGLVAFFVIVAILFIFGSIGETNEPKCIRAGCDNKQASGSSSSSYSNESSGGTSTRDSSSSSYSNDTNTTSGSSYSSSTKKSTYDSYDDGYDDIYMDGDYDYDRYDRDSDYADGVDDAMDEFGEDW